MSLTKSLARRLDRMPFDWMLALGAIMGLAMAAGFWWLPGGSMIALIALIALIGLAAWSAQPVGVWEEPVAEVERFLDMVSIEGGIFMMGSPVGEKGRYTDETQHPVTVADFEMSRTVVTRAQYREILGLDEAPGPGGDDHPVTRVSWFDALAFCNRLSERDLLEPCYLIQGKEVAWLENAGGYRLPTEAEWEYAARAGSKGRWPFWRTLLNRYAWFQENSGGHAHSVASRLPNRWGLFDTHGNIWEWCWDGYAEYDFASAIDPKGPRLSSSRLLRGGSFAGEAWILRSACRARAAPEISGRVIGFRYVRRPVLQPRNIDGSTH